MSDILRFSSNHLPSWCDFDLSELVYDICESFEEQSLRRGVHLDVDAPPNTILHGDREQLEAALRALVADAIRVSPKTGDVVLTTFEEDGFVEIEVADSAAGVFADSTAGQTHVSPAEDSMPPSLRLVQQIAESHGGKCFVTECPDGGRAVTLQIPRIDQSRQRRSAA